MFLPFVPVKIPFDANRQNARLCAKEHEETHMVTWPHGHTAHEYSMQNSAMKKCGLFWLLLVSETNGAAKSLS